jgi:hypothetical protein
MICSNAFLGNNSGQQVSAVAVSPHLTHTRSREVIGQDVGCGCRC